MNGPDPSWPRSGHTTPGDPQGPVPPGFGVIAVDVRDRQGPLGTNHRYKPRIRIDGGKPTRAVWGVNRIPVPAGHHRVEVSVKFGVGEGGRTETAVVVPPGQTVSVEYQPPFGQMGAGSIRVDHPVAGVEIGPIPRNRARQQAFGLTLLVLLALMLFLVFWLGSHQY